MTQVTTGCVSKNLMLRILTVKKHKKTGLKLIIHFKTFKFFKLWIGQETAIAEVPMIKDDRFPNVGFVKHFYIGSGFC